MTTTTKEQLIKTSRIAAFRSPETRCRMATVAIQVSFQVTSNSRRLYELMTPIPAVVASDWEVSE